MSLIKIKCQPNSDGYAIKEGNEVISVELDGGGPRMRRDKIGAVAVANVKWDCHQARYDYLKAFHRTATAKGSLPFNIDLVLDNSVPTTYKVRFVPDSFNLESQI